MALNQINKLIIMWFIVLVMAACVKENYLDEEVTEFSLVAVNPLNNSSDVAVNSKIYASFNELVDQTSLNPYTFLVTDAKGELVNGRVSFNSISKTAMFEPYLPLSYDTQLRLIISNKIRNKTGKNLSNTFNVLFQTQKAPEDSSFNPPDGVKDVSPRSRIRLQFNDNVYINSLNKTGLILKETITGTHVEFDFELDKALLTATLSVSDDYNFSQGFKPDTQYTYTITTDVLNRSGDPFFDEDKSITFTTSKTTPFTNTVASNREDFVTSINLVNDGSLILAGNTWGALDGQSVKRYDGDGFIAAIDPINGKVHDAIQFGSGRSSNSNLKITDSVSDMLTIGNDIYVTGVTNGNLQENDLYPGSSKMFIAKYIWNGVSLQSSDFLPVVVSVNGDLGAYAIARNSIGDAIYIAGTTTGYFPGTSNKGKQDVFVAKYDTDLNQVWIRQYGTEAMDIAKGIAVDGDSIFITGDSFGHFTENKTSPDSLNSFILRLDESNGEQVSYDFDTSGIETNPDKALARIASGIIAKNGDIFLVGTQWFANKSSVFGLIFNADGSGPIYIEYNNNVDSEDAQATGIYLSPEGDVYVAITKFSVQQVGAITDIVKFSAAGFNQYKSLKSGDFTSVRSMVIDRTGSFFATGFINGNIDGMMPLGKGDVFIAAP